MKEFEYIHWLRQRTDPDPRVLVGPGDDCAVLRTVRWPLLVTTDMLLEGTHFRLAEDGARRIGRKLLAVNLSDMAAMAGKPLAAVASVGLPRDGPAHLAEELSQGLRHLANEFNTAIIGGDTNSWTGGLVMSLTLIGQIQAPGPVLRSGARPGDWLLVTGPLGGSILGKHLDFTPRVAEALQLRRRTLLHAMIDISDGLAGDLKHICAESGCGAILHAGDIPISAAAFDLARNDTRTPLEHALTDGEDFELLIALAPDDAARLLQTQPIPGMTLSHVGECTQDEGVFLEEGGRRRPLEMHGYEHEIT